MRKVTRAPPQKRAVSSPATVQYTWALLSAVFMNQVPVAWPAATAAGSAERTASTPNRPLRDRFGEWFLETQLGPASPTRTGTGQP